MKRYLIGFALCVSALAGPAQAADLMWLIPADEQVRVWNQFVKDVYALNMRQVAKTETVQTETLGGYELYPNFYREVTYKEKKSGRVLGVVQWERAQPDRIHSIDVYIYDAQGRRTRDYSAIYLPWGRNAPIQTLVSFYDYQPTFSAFRKFDASGRRVYDQCTGEIDGKPVDLELDEFDMARQYDSVMKGAVYRACFAHLPLTAGKYLTPQ